MKKFLFSALLIQGSVFAQSYTRTSLLEEFTGEDCGPCAIYNPSLDSTLALYSNKVIPIKWFVPIPSAPNSTWSLYQTNQPEIEWRYGPTTTGYGYPTQNMPGNPILNGIHNAPTVRLDGRHQWDFGATSDHPYYTTSVVINAAQS